MNIDIIFHYQPSSNFAKFRIFELIFKKLKTYSDYNFTVINPHSLDIPTMENVASIKGLLMCTLVNKENNKAILINLADRLEPNLLPNHGYDNFNIVQVIGGMSVSSYEYTKNKEFIDAKRLPLMIPVDKVEEDEYLVKCSRNTGKKIKKAFFIGNVYGGRSEIVEILNTHPLFEIKHSIREEGLPFKEYIKEMQKYSLCLSLNGFAEICYRDIEAMGAYVPVVRSEFFNQYFKEIIPNHHYIVGSEPSTNGFLGYSKSPKEIAMQFIDKVEKVINDELYLDTVAYNGRKYYEGNCTVESITENAISILNLNLLK